MVHAVLWSSIGRRRRRSRMWKKQVLVSWVMCSEKVRFLSKITPRFLTGLDEGKVEDEEGDFKVIDWSVSLLSWSGRPISRNSVLEGFKERRLVDIHAVGDAGDSFDKMRYRLLIGRRREGNEELGVVGVEMVVCWGGID
jgi:hypothetical protein